ncbi:aminotransferase class I/II-fold pyridoxal phosphate-dependent enzyme, partial [Litorivicinus sp.]|nr:aminotransferase class I/II-fold pyridoxal phosphate-dependent enzyme [Litorivicinus sp.]
MIRLSRSSVGSAEKEAVSRVLDEGFLGFGPESFGFEAELADFFGQDVAVVGSGTAGLQLALQSLGLGPGDEVIVPTITYVATFMAVSATGATPIPAAVNENFLLDPTEIKRLQNSRTKCVLPVLYAGLSSNLEEIYQICVGLGLDIVVDAAHAFGQDYYLGSALPIRVLHCFSFDGIKNITSGEGGAVLSNDQDALAHIANARLLGVERDSHARKEGGR